LNDHLTPAELQTSLRTELSRKRWREVVRHLLRGCEECRASLAGGLHPTALPPEAAYDEALDAFERILRAEHLFRHRNASNAAEAERTGEGPADLESLLERSWAARYDDPRRMVHCASAAVELALGLDPALYGARRVADWQARAWGELANAQRVANDLWDAQRSFGEAFKLLEKGTGDRLLKARLHDFHASLLGTQRKFAFALKALDVVYHLYLEVGDLHLAGRSFLTKAVYMHYDGRSEEAIALNDRGLSLIDEQRDPELLAAALQNQIWFLVACRRYEEAKDLLLQSRRRSRGFGQVGAVKTRWLQGQIEYGLGNIEAAEPIFQEVRQEFEKLDLGFAAALATFDLALVWMNQGRIREAEEVVIEATGVFNALEIHREVLGAVQVLKEAFRLKKASLELVAETAAFVREWGLHSDTRTLSLSS
jgi:tetratricopeptide (TPR) repeat protein